jgi:FtsP/CotA-like multicopper oxidase with cupredoxin domain
MKTSLRTSSAEAKPDADGKGTIARRNRGQDQEQQQEKLSAAYASLACRTRENERPIHRCGERLPASMKSADMLAVNPGRCMFYCHVADHITAGTTSMYRVHEK